MRAMVKMWPEAGTNVLKYCGDWIHFRFWIENGSPIPETWKVFLRTNLGRGDREHREIIRSHTYKWPLEGGAWHDIPMHIQGDKAVLDYPMHETGYFEAKAYAVDENGWQIWPESGNLGISIHPDFCRTSNIFYCAFTRLFGENISRIHALPEKEESELLRLESEGFTCIPPSGKFRDLIKHLPHIIDTLGCKIIHLLPINPTPTTMARMGRFGSPYAALDLTGIDPALVEFEHKTTAVDQFCELSDAIHQRRAKLIIDLAINHTGWGSWLHTQHPEWYVKDAGGNFVSPGAWGVTWGDLSELNTHLPDLWEYLAGVFITWCQRGVDGFRCDAGYKIPMEAWRYIISRVHSKFPEAFFLLEGLGGSYEATENLLTHGRMQFAYSELFQNYSARDISKYLDYAIDQSHRRGIWIHYSETHDNNRLAASGKKWSLFRNQLCALTSICGGFGFTCGVEWLASEKIAVHQRSGLAWGNPDNIIKELAKLNHLLSEHPCFFDGATLTRLTPLNSQIYCLRRDSAEKKNTLWILANPQMELSSQIELCDPDLQTKMIDLLTGETITSTPSNQSNGKIFTLPAGTCWCLACDTKIKGLSGEDYRRRRALASWALSQINQLIPGRYVAEIPWQELAKIAEEDICAFLTAINHTSRENIDSLKTQNNQNAFVYLRQHLEEQNFSEVISWTLADARRITLLPRGHWLLICNKAPFQIQLFSREAETNTIQAVSTPLGYIAAFSPQKIANLSSEQIAPLQLNYTDWGESHHHLKSSLLLISALAPFNMPHENPRLELKPAAKHQYLIQKQDQYKLCENQDTLILLTNDRGGMSRICANIGTVFSKYDCLLGANLNPNHPEDRHIFIKRMRVWVNANGFLSEINDRTLAILSPESPAKWDFIVSAGDGYMAHIRLTVDLLRERNTLILRWERPYNAPSRHNSLLLSPQAPVSVTLRLDIEDRNFHTETHLNDGARWHFSSNTHTLQNEIGFSFTPAPDRQFRVTASNGRYHEQQEWMYNIPHPIESTRGQTAYGDAFSPGWFELPLETDKPVLVTIDAEPEPVEPSLADWFEEQRQVENNAILQKYSSAPITDSWERDLVLTASSFLARRGIERGKTVIAGFPWFLDWGRDTLICARGLLAAGCWDDILELTTVFAAMEKNGTLPNVIYGDNDSNRDTVDAPLWFGILLEEMAEAAPRYGSDAQTIYSTTVAPGKTLLDTLRSIALNYLQGTPNGIFVDRQSGLVWAPEHFTWMDTNYPAGTPRCGYPIEIQALWIRLLQQLARLEPENSDWQTLSTLAWSSLKNKFWLPQKGWYADGIWAENRKPAFEGRIDDALRPNQYYAIALGLLSDQPARSAVQAGFRYLLIPGAMRSLAPLPVDCLAPVYGKDPSLLNDPKNPYWPRYEGDEDTRRKPAYHNGTAWGFQMPPFCEAIVQAWPGDMIARQTACAILRSTEYWMKQGCLRYIPEIMDGDYPHTPRGCDAQAWSTCETLRVWKQIKLTSHIQ